MPCGLALLKNKKGRQCRPLKVSNDALDQARVPRGALRLPAYAAWPVRCCFGPAWVVGRAEGRACGREAGRLGGRWPPPPPFFGIGASRRIGRLGS